MIAAMRRHGLARRGWALRAALVALVPICATYSPSAAAEATSEVDPDRPDISNSARTLPRGVVQVESGAEYARTSRGGTSAERRLAVQLDVRAGLTDRLEARLESEPLVRLRGPDDDTGSGDYTFGVKYRFFDPADRSAWPTLAAILFVKAPVAASPIGSERPDFGGRLLASFDLPATLGLDLNAGMTAVGQSRPSGYLLQAFVAASLSHELTERLSPFVEVVYTSREERRGRDALLLDAGLVYKLTRWLAVDAAASTSLAGVIPDYAFVAGFTVRFGR
jgi:hypothetical protein